MKSIRNRLNITITVSLLLVFTAAAVVIHVRVSSRVERIFDTTLLDKSHALISLTELDAEGLEFDFAESGVMSEFDEGDSPQYYQLWDRDAGELIKSPSLDENELPRTGVKPGQHRLFDLTLPDGRPGRAIEIEFIPRMDDDDDEGGTRDDAQLIAATPVTLVLARERESLDDTLLSIGVSILGIGLVVLTVSTLLIRWLVRKGLSPLANLARRVSGIDASNLDTRVSVEGAQNAEIAPIVNQLNHLLERLQAAFEREKRFSSNVAHELRTPISELKSLCEVGHLVTEDPEQIAMFFNDVGEISKQMENVVTTLLELSRSEAGLMRVEPETIALSSYCDELWRHAVNGQQARNTLVKNISDELLVRADREKLGMILTNLITNAIQYSPEDSQIYLSARARDSDTVLKVKNIATDLAREDLAHMTDRFWRKQRIQDCSGHAGLGLTLVEALARLMQLDLDLKLDSRNMLIVTVAGLPLATVR